MRAGAGALTHSPHSLTHSLAHSTLLLASLLNMMFTYPLHSLINEQPQPLTNQP